MKRPGQKLFSIFLGAILLAGGFAGCASNPEKTVHGNLLDDTVTTERVHAALNRASQTDFKQVQVSTGANGAVVLSGTVASPEIQKRAVQIARGVDRVKSLTDHLKVQKNRSPSQ
jgi:osmotically-inducible protein OsmY